MVGYDPHVKDLPQYTYAFAGAASGLFTRAVSQPLDVLKIRFQLQEQPIRPSVYSKYHGLIHATWTIWKEEGVRAFWKGHNPAQLLSVVYGVVQFTSFEFLTREVWHWLPSYLTTDLQPATYFICGGLAGCSGTLASLPFDVVRTRIVAQGEPKVYRSVLDATRQIVAKESIFGLYRGLLPTLLQIGPQTGFQFAFYSAFSSLWMFLARRFEMPHLATGGFSGLVCGSAAGLCAKMLVYPLDVVKKRLQVQGFEYGHVVVGCVRQYKGFVHCLRQIVVFEGFRALYKGLGPSLLKAVVSTGLHFSAYEQCVRIFRRMYTRI